MIDAPETRVAVIANVTFPDPVDVLAAERVTVFPKILVTVAPAPIPVPVAAFPTAIPAIVETVMSVLPLVRETAEIVVLVLGKDVGGMSHGDM
jgi:hypothetical protein